MKAKNPKKIPTERVGKNRALIPGNPGNSGGKKGRSGRPPSALREQLRGSFADRIPILECMADNTSASASDRLKALDMMARYGLGTTSTSTDAEGNDGSGHRTHTLDEREAGGRWCVRHDW